MTKREKATNSEPRTPRPRHVLTKAERVAVYTLATGRCFVFGTLLDPFADWSVVTENGNAYLLSPEAKKLKGGRTLEELRALVSEDLQAADDNEKRARQSAAAAKDAFDAKSKSYARLLDANGAVVFAGERPAEAVEA